MIYILTYIVVLCSRYDFTPTEHEKAKIVEVLGSVIIRGDSFVRTAAIHDPNMQKVAPTVPILNPQTVSLCEKLGIDDPVQVLMARSGRIMKEPCDNGSIWEEPTPAQVVQTPQKPVKMSLQLPEPVTPSASEVAPKIFSPGTTPVSDSLESTFECKTPMSGGPKKTFKRRNLSIYNTPDCDESNSTETSSLLDSDSPKYSKLPFRQSYE